MHNVRTISWLANRALTHDIVPQAVPVPSSGASASHIAGIALGWINIIPSWVILAMIIFAGSGVCVTVILRAQTEFKASSSQHQGMLADIDSVRRTNDLLQLEINHLTNDSSAIELAARERLGMVRPNDVVVPIESVTSSSSLGTLSFVR